MKKTGNLTGLQVCNATFKLGVSYSAWCCGLLLVVFFTVLSCSTLAISSRIIIGCSIMIQGTWSSNIVYQNCQNMVLMMN